jgi:hypothetical protein
MGAVYGEPRANGERLGRERLGAIIDRAKVSGDGAARLA